MECAKLGHVVIAAAIRQWRRQQVKISVACFVAYTSLAIFLTRCYQLGSSFANLEATVGVG